jgi:hypothetical protein
MLPTSLVALGIILIAVLPGAVYTWAFEREAGSYGVTLADRTLRFLAASTWRACGDGPKTLAARTRSGRVRRLQRTLPLAAAQ